MTQAMQKRHSASWKRVGGGDNYYSIYLLRMRSKLGLHERTHILVEAREHFVLVEWVVLARPL